MSNQDEPGQQPEPEHRPEDYLRTNPDGSQTPQYPGQAPEPPTNPYGAAETSSYGTPPTHTPYGQPPTPPTQPYAAQPPPYGQDPYGQDPSAASGSYGQPGQYGYGQPGYAAPPPHPQATTALVLGLVSLIGMFICLFPILAAPFAWRTGGRVVKEIDAQPGRWSGREQAQAGRIMGIIGTVLLVLGIDRPRRPDRAAVRRGRRRQHDLRQHDVRVGVELLELAADEHRLVDQPHAVRRLDAVADLAGQRQQVVGAGAAPVGQRQRVLGGQAGAPAAQVEPVALAEAGVLDEPRRARLGATVRLLPARGVVGQRGGLLGR